MTWKAGVVTLLIGLMLIIPVVAAEQNSLAGSSLQGGSGGFPPTIWGWMDRWMVKYHIDICDGRDNDRDGQIDEGNPGGGFPCYTGKKGVCSSGTTQCDKGRIVCVQNVQASADSQCDGRDNDCDGKVDEAYQPHETSCGTGVCTATGQTSCHKGVEKTNCIPGKPSAEICDGLDNDCDGSIDDGNPGGGISCNTGLPGICSAGTNQCSDTGISCVQTSQPSDETCNGLDDDCDGAVDEGYPGAGDACNTGKPGICSAGTNQCTTGGFSCVQTSQPSDETCNGLDDNCNGAVDEGYPGAGDACNTGKPGICSAGMTQCSAGGIICAQTSQPKAEECNGLDDDCDGAVDVGYPGDGEACNTGNLGVCSAGTNQCTANGIICAQTSQPKDEICNGLDDDCDGAVDVGIKEVGKKCETDLPGICQDGTKECLIGNLICVQTNHPKDEECNGLDDNCDGQIDEGLGTTTCGVGECTRTVDNCVGGKEEKCKEGKPSDEVCNTLDDDCDGTVDNGFPEIGTPCDTSLPGICAPGTYQCDTNGDSSCIPNVQPGVKIEICDGLGNEGLDNDCDGYVNEMPDACGGRTNELCDNTLSGFQCQCNTGFSRCANNECTDLSTPENCGACGHSCPENQQCVNFSGDLNNPEYGCL